MREHTPSNLFESFHDGQVWESPRGVLYRVERVYAGQATLRVGTEGPGRLIKRAWDDVEGWVCRVAREPIEEQAPGT